MPQMSPLLWTSMAIYTISLLLSISSFFYFMSTPTFPSTSSYLSLPQVHIYSPSMFNWLW